MTKNYIEAQISFKPSFLSLRKPLLLLLPLFFFITSLHSQNEAPITIYGNYTSQKAVSPAAVTIISKKEIEESGATNVADIIKRYSSILINTNGTRDSINSTSIRGSRSTQVAILIDGVKVNSPTGATGNDLSKIPASIIEKIEIIANPASSFTSDQSAAGSILVTTKNYGKASYEGGYLYNHNNGHEINFFTTQPIAERGSSFFTGFSFLYNPKEKEIVGGDTIIQTIIANGVFNWKKENSFYQLSLTNYLEENFNKENSSTITQLFNSLHALHFELKNPLNRFPKSSYNLTFAFRPISSYYAPYNQKAVKNLTLDFTIKNNLNFVYLWNNNSLTFGTTINYNPQLLLSSSLGKIARHIINSKSGLEIAFNHKEREVGIFQLSSSIDGILGDKNLFFASAFGGFLFYLDAKKILSLKLSSSNGYRAPNFNELYYSSSFFNANPNLVAEKSVSFDSAFVITPTKEVELGIGYFFRKEYSPIVWGPKSVVQLPQTDFNGLELYLNLSYELENGFVTNLNTNYLLNYGIYKPSQKPFDQTHPHIFKSYLMMGYKKYFRLSNQINYYSGYSYTGGTISEFVEWNIWAEIGIKNIYLSFGGENILNMPLRFHPYTTVLPPSFFIGLKYRGTPSQSM